MLDLATRTALAQALSVHPALARPVTAPLSTYIPEGEQRFGPQGRLRGLESARFHLSSLAGAVQTGTPELFAQNVHWCAKMLEARSIDRAQLLEYLVLLEERLNLQDAAQGFVHTFFEHARTALQSPVSTREEVTCKPTALQTAYLTAILAGNRKDAWEVTREALRQGRSVSDLYQDLLLWAQQQLGELWVAAKITVATEHMASAITQMVLARLYAELPSVRTAGRLLLAGVEGELHNLPAQLAADLLEFDGWDVAFVGTNVPETALVTAVETEKPSVLGLSTTMLSHLPHTVSVVQKLRVQFPTLPILLGGFATRGIEPLARELGVELATDNPSAVLQPYRADAR